MKPPYEPPVTPSRVASTHCHCAGGVDGRHAVRGVLVAPVGEDARRERLAVALAAARIGVQHRVPAGGQHLKFVHERRGVHRLGPAVDFEHQRPLLARR